MSKPSDLEGRSKVETHGYELALENGCRNSAAGSTLRDIYWIDGCPWPTIAPSVSNVHLSGLQRPSK
jgi:hypothetical protein